MRHFQNQFLSSARSGLAGLRGGNGLQQQFQSPPDAARPRTWWHWVSGNVSAEGITADLAAMKEIGVGGCQLFTVDQSNVRGPVKFMSPEWRGFVKQALGERTSWVLGDFH